MAALSARKQVRVAFADCANEARGADADAAGPAAQSHSPPGGSGSDCRYVDSAEDRAGNDRFASPQEATAADVRPSPDAPNEELKPGRGQHRIRRFGNEDASARLRHNFTHRGSRTGSGPNGSDHDIGALDTTNTCGGDLNLRSSIAGREPYSAARQRKLRPLKSKRQRSLGVLRFERSEYWRATDGLWQSAIDHAHQLAEKGQVRRCHCGDAASRRVSEMIEIWGGRMAYTAYLNIGLKRSWILQYSLPRTDVVAAPGNLARLEAPWPYEIARPLLMFGDFNAKALVLHGFVNQAGRFESLALVYPPQLAQAEFVLYALQRWQFRARQRKWEKR